MIDLNSAPPSNRYLTEDMFDKEEIYYPLRVFVCAECMLVQTEDFLEAKSLFEHDYTYMSSTSDSWLKHSKLFAEQIVRKLELTKKSQVIEIASNDGYLLQYFQKQNIPCVGIEPTRIAAEKAMSKGIPTIIEFFGESAMLSGKIKVEPANLVVANNVLAHVPDVNDFARGLKYLLTDDGIVSIEFPHVLNLLIQLQFDTIYHEHFSYFSLTSAKSILETAGLTVFDAEEIKTHGGSLRVFATLKEDKTKTERLRRILLKENEFGLNELSIYVGFADRVLQKKLKILEFFVNQKKQNKTVFGYGAAAKGNTLLNYCGIGSDFLSGVFDNAHTKQNKYLPGSRSPIYTPRDFAKFSPDIVVVFPWNIAEEILKEINQIDKDVHVYTLLPDIQRLQ
jgi:SAM-dependent methyltransferase